MLSRPAKMIELLFVIPTHTDLSGCLKASQVCMNSEASGYINSGVFFCWLMAGTRPPALLTVGPVRSHRGITAGLYKTSEDVVDRTLYPYYTQLHRNI